jgi:hypothetical protein
VFALSPLAVAIAGSNSFLCTESRSLAGRALEMALAASMLHCTQRYACLECGKHTRRVRWNAGTHINLAPQTQRRYNKREIKDLPQCSALQESQRNFNYPYSAHISTPKLATQANEIVIVNFII